MLNDISMQVAQVVGLVGGIGFLAAALYKIYKLMQKVDEAIGVDEQGRTLSHRTKRIEYQLWENGGESLKDKMNETADLAKETATKLQLIEDILLQLVGSQEKPKRTRKPAA